MYKITHINTDFQYKEIPEGINPDSIRKWTYLQLEQANCQNETNVYFQEDVPRDSESNIVNSLYWKLVDGIVIEMTNEEKLAVDIEIENKRINNIYFGFAYKIEVFDFQSAIAYKIKDENNVILGQPFNDYAQVILNTLIPNNAKVVMEDIFINPPTFQIRTKANVYTNFLNIPTLGSMVTAQTLADDGITLVDIITTIEPNPVFEIFNPYTDLINTNNTVNIIINEDI